MKFHELISLVEAYGAIGDTGYNRMGNAWGFSMAWALYIEKRMIEYGGF